MELPELSVVLGVIAVILGTIGAVCGIYVLCFQKPEPAPTHARLLAKPGVTLDLVDTEGVIVAKVMLARFTRSRDRGTTADFEDYSRWLMRNVVPKEWR